MRLRGRYVSGPTIQNILARNRMATMYDRLLKLEEKAASEPIELTAEQTALIEKAQSLLPGKACRVQPSRGAPGPGHLLRRSPQGCGQGVRAGSGRHLRQLCFRVPPHREAARVRGGRPCVATCSPSTRAWVSRSRPSSPTTAGSTAARTPTPYELYLALNDIEHRRTKVGRPQTNGVVERFNRTALDEFFRKALREKFYESVEALQADLDAWLVHCNTERPHRGYRNMGRRPMETINVYLESVKGEG